MKKLQRAIITMAVIFSVLGLGFLAGAKSSVDSNESADLPKTMTFVSWAETFNSVDELFARADAVVSVIVQNPARDLDSWEYPVVETVVNVTESFKGKFKEGARIPVHQPGSILAENLELPFMRPGVHYLLFLIQQYENQPQHYILGPDAIYSFTDEGLFHRESSISPLVRFDFQLPQLRKLDPVRFIASEPSDRFETYKELLAAAQDVLVVQVDSNPVELEARKIPTVSIHLKILEVVKGSHSTQDSLELEMFADLDNQLKFEGGMPPVLQKSKKYLVFLSQSAPGKNLYTLLDFGGVLESQDGRKFKRSFYLDTKLPSEVDLLNLE